jgi:hypothetical protein
MHTYRRKLDTNAWQVVFDGEPIGPTWDEEFEAAAFAAFMNGGRYSPGEIEPIFPKEYPDVTDDDTSIHPDRPKSFDDDYPLERKRG